MTHKLIEDAVMSDDKLKVENITGDLLWLTSYVDGREALIALDFHGAALLAELLIPFLRNHPEIKTVSESAS